MILFFEKKIAFLKLGGKTFTLANKWQGVAVFT